MEKSDPLDNQINGGGEMAKSQC